jgi:hypothetical protein
MHVKVGGYPTREIQKNLSFSSVLSKINERREILH